MSLSSENGPFGPNGYVLLLLGTLWILVGEIGAQNELTNAIDPDQSPVASSFIKLIPQFNPNAITVQFKTDARIALSPANPSFVPFLIQYPKIAENEIDQSNDAAFRDEMIAFFKSKYGSFLSEVGLPVGCISFYIGATDLNTIKELESLTDSLNNEKRKYRRNRLLFSGISGNELTRRLNLDQITGAFKENVAMTRGSPTVCGSIFWTLKDGTIVANLPSTDFASRQVWIPTMKFAINIFKSDVTRGLSEYFSTGVSCLDNIVTKRNFSSTVSKWMSVKLIPQILQSQTCISGFSRVLQLWISIEKYKHTLVYDMPEIPTTTMTLKSANKVLARKKRQITKSKEGIREGGGYEQKNMLKRKGQLSEKEMEEILYNEELKHLYDKMDNIFRRHNLEIANLDVVQLPSENKNRHLVAPRPIFFSTTTTTTTTTSTTTPKTITRKALNEPNNERQNEKTQHNVEPVEKPVKIISEVDIDENNLHEPISVFVEGDKLTATLDVQPKGYKPGNALHFQSIQSAKPINPLNSHWHPGKHEQHHLPVDPRKVRPLHMRQFILHKKFGQVPVADNFIAAFADSAVHKIQDSAHALFPKLVHGTHSDHIPKMHSFRPVEMASQSHPLAQHKMGPREQKDHNIVKQVVQNYHARQKRPGAKPLSRIDEGLVELYDTDREFPNRSLQ